jgi:N-acetylmuramoyl-L-alanine amidase
MIRAVLPFVGLFCAAVVTGGTALSGITAAQVPTHVPAAVVTDIRAGEHRGATRVVFDVSNAIAVKIFTLAAPYRVVLDFPVVGWRLPQRPLPRGVGLLDKLRYGLFEPGTTRVVIDVIAPVRLINARILASTSGNSHRLVLDLTKTTQAAFLDGLKKPPVTVSQTASIDPAPAQARPGMLVPPAKTAMPVSDRQGTPQVAGFPFMLPPKKPRSLQKRIIVIDPGHGGADPGAISVNGVYEKHLTLAAAREFKEQLEKTGRYKVLLTRGRDVFIKLRERVEFAREANADLFISVHADKIQNRRIRGLSVHTLSKTASDKEAAELAERENKADLIVGVDLSKENTDVTNILIDLAQRETMNQSARFATVLVGELKQETKLLRNTHRFAGFAVLKAPDVPSVLLEMGFLSNTYDERNLRRKDYRRKLAQSMTRAVDRYFARIEQAAR